MKMKETKSDGDLLLEWTNEHYPGYSQASETVGKAWRNYISAMTVSPRNITTEWLERVIPSMLNDGKLLIESGEISTEVLIEAVRFSMSLSPGNIDDATQRHVIKTLEVVFKNESTTLDF